jgi:hypothetical protein
VEVCAGPLNGMGFAAGGYWSQLVAAPLVAPPLPACDEAEPAEAATAAPGDSQEDWGLSRYKAVNSSRSYKIRRHFRTNVGRRQQF